MNSKEVADLSTKIAMIHQIGDSEGRFQEAKSS